MYKSRSNSGWFLDANAVTNNLLWRMSAGLAQLQTQHNLMHRNNTITALSSDVNYKLTFFSMKYDDLMCAELPCPFVHLVLKTSLHSVMTVCIFADDGGFGWPGAKRVVPVPLDFKASSLGWWIWMVCYVGVAWCMVKHWIAHLNEFQSLWACSNIQGYIFIFTIVSKLSIVDGF